MKFLLWFLLSITMACKTDSNQSKRVNEPPPTGDENQVEVRPDTANKEEDPAPPKKPCASNEYSKKTGQCVKIPPCQSSEVFNRREEKCAPLPVPDDYYPVVSYRNCILVGIKIGKCTLDPFNIDFSSQGTSGTVVSFETFIDGDCTTSYPISLGIFSGDEKLGTVDIFSQNKSALIELGKAFNFLIVKRVDKLASLATYRDSCVIAVKASASMI